MWQALLKKADQSINYQLWSQAEEYYHQAVECLEQHLTEDAKDANLLLAWVNTFRQLSALYEQQNKPQIALRYIQIPHQRLTEIVQYEKSDEVMRLVALRTLKVTLSTLLEFSKKYPACDRCLASLRKMERSVNECQPVIH